MPRRVHFDFDERHPIGASHHQKIVVVDDSLAFCGGIDLTSHRWDTSEHRVDEPRRVTPLGEHYGPYHEIQAMVDGPVAASLGMLARNRWRTLGAERLPPVRREPRGLWPSQVDADIQDIDVAISLTWPRPYSDEPEPQPARQCEALFVDSIAAARQAIYIESQYFTNAHLADRLTARLQEPDGPEVVIVTPWEVHGWLEQNTIGPFREQVCRRLIAADRHKRLRIVYPVASRARDLSTFVHSKVMIVDDWFARIGSTNFNYRSMGVDSECDLAVDAGDDARAREGVLRIRNRLLAEHLGVRPDDVALEIGRAGSMAALIDAHEREDRTLALIELPATPTPEPSDALRAAVDPDEPIGFGAEVGRLIPAVEVAEGGNPQRLWILPGCVLAAALIVAVASGAFPQPELRSVQSTIAELPTLNGAVVASTAAFVVAGVALIPLELVAIAAGLLLGFVPGGFVVFLGSLVAAVLGYVAGRVIGPERLSRWMSRASFRKGRQLGALGVKGVVMLRLSALMTAGAAHLLCGAGRVPVGSYMAGTVIGLLPSLVVLTAIGTLLRRTLLDPSLESALTTIGAVLVVSILALVVRTVLVIRQFTPANASQRQRAEFG
jgi:phospholipase D1/2